ncbi:MAG: hypothetical protein ACR2IK_20775, partial [Chloroflexota bacterium]
LQPHSTAVLAKRSDGKPQRKPSTLSYTPVKSDQAVLRPPVESTMDTAMHRAAEPGVDLSHLQTPDLVAPAFVQLLDLTAASGRFEAQRMLSPSTN